MGIYVCIEVITYVVKRQKQTQSNYDIMRNAMFKRMAFVVFLTYPSLCQSTFLSLPTNCVDLSLQGTEASFLISDFTIRCDKPSFHIYTIFNLFILASFVLGLPIFFSYLLYTFAVVNQSEDDDGVAD